MELCSLSPVLDGPLRVTPAPRSSIALLIAAAFAVSAAVAVPAKGPWKAVAQPFGFEPREVAEAFWVGLRNTSDRDRAFCVVVRYGYSVGNEGLVDQSSEEYPAIGWVGPCSQDGITLVRAGETYFVKVRPRLPADFVRSQGLRFRISAREALSVVELLADIFANPDRLGGSMLRNRSVSASWLFLPQKHQMARPSNKGMKLTKPERNGALQLIPGVRRT